MIAEQSGMTKFSDERHITPLFLLQIILTNGFGVSRGFPEQYIVNMIRTVGAKWIQSRCLGVRREGGIPNPPCLLTKPGEAGIPRIPFFPEKCIAIFPLADKWGRTTNQIIATNQDLKSTHPLRRKRVESPQTEITRHPNNYSSAKRTYLLYIP
jgi:hypothetical protein